MNRIRCVVLAMLLCAVMPLSFGADSDVSKASIDTLWVVIAGCATMEPRYAILIGFISGIIVVMGAKLLLRLKIDDVVGAIPVHGFAGVWGTVAAGLFYSGNMFAVDLVAVQIIGALACFVWAFVGGLFIYVMVNAFTPLRAEAQHEQRGLDITEHGEVGYPEFRKSAAYTSASIGELER